MSPVRVLAIETSTSQASVALCDSGQLVLERSSARPKQSAERLLPMIAEVLGEAGWPASSLERLGVSVGPGSFTGLRVGIACAQGLSLGLGIPLVGVTSLQAMARAVPANILGLRAALLDARRAEVFAGVYEAGPRAAEHLAPFAVAAAGAANTLSAQLAQPLVWIGSGLTLAGIEPTFASPQTNEPSAQAVGLLAEELNPRDHPAIPVYVRDAGATLPNLGAPARL
jgi:tRNA threonylcarbamoyladenosine biosynthesis protein TsaB